jgi:hypothetical protein
VSVISPNSLNAVAIAVAWAPYPGYFATTNWIVGSNFAADKTIGGLQVPVFGPALIVGVSNNGSTAITIHQLAVYAFMH